MRHASIGVAIVALVVGPAFADPVVKPMKKIKGNWTVKNESGSDASDFHVFAKIKGGAAYVQGQFYDDKTFVAPGERTDVFSPEGSDTNVKLDWQTLDGHTVVDDGASIHLGYDFQSNNTDISIVQAYWTAGGIPVPASRANDPKLPGFEVGSFRLSNDTGGEMIIEDLQFLVSPGEVPLAAMMPYTFGGWGTSAGAGAFVPAFAIPDGGAFDVTGFLPGPVGDTEFLLYQFRSHGTGTPSPITEGMFEVQGPVSAAVPEPSGLALWSGLGLMGGLEWWRRKRR